MTICMYCESDKSVVKKGFNQLKNGTRLQRYLCRSCNKQFNDRTGTPMSRLRKDSTQMAKVLHMRSEGLGIRATGRVEGISHGTVIHWERRLSAQADNWSPSALVDSDITVEGDELYTKVAKNQPAHQSCGWTLTLLERHSRYWIGAIAGSKDDNLFRLGMEVMWNWVMLAAYVCFFTDGEARYSKYFWQLAHVWLHPCETTPESGCRKVWRQGIDVASKVKKSQGRRRVRRSKPEHPFTAISPNVDVHANHNEALNSSIRRRCSAYRRRQNHYAKNIDGLNRAVTVLRLIHNWVRPHPSLGKNVTPAMAIGFINRPVSFLELLSSRGFQSLPL